jgi:hypothetical protein
MDAGALSHHEIKVKRSPTVVWLDQPPKEVFVTFDAAG